MLRRMLKIVWIVVYYRLDLCLPTFGGRYGYIRKIIAMGLFWHRPKVTDAQRLRLALEALGPIFVKFGQVLSTRKDLLSPELADELAKLQDQVPPFASEIAIKTIERNLKGSITSLFQHFDATPIASASIAQVHYAELLAGQKVAVKVLRPGIQDIIEKDIALLKRLATLIEKCFVEAKRLKPREVVAEFDQYLHDELDLTIEAANASQIRRNFHDTSILYVPEVFFSYCAKEVMVMEWVEGIPISHIDRLQAANIDLKLLAKHGVEIFFTQVFRDGFFHADMHPGNILVGQDGRYIAVDFGIVGSLSEFDKHYLAVNFLAFFNRDYKGVAQAHLECGWVPENTKIEALEAGIRAVCEPIFNKPLADISFGLLLLRLFEISRRFQVEIQPQLVLLQKTLLNIEGLGRQLDPKLDLWQTAKPFLERWMSEQVGLRALLNNFREEASGWAKILPQLPRKLYELVNVASKALPWAGQEAFLAEQKKHNRLLRIQICLLGMSMSLGIGWLLKGLLA